MTALRRGHEPMSLSVPSTPPPLPLPHTTNPPTPNYTSSSSPQLPYLSALFLISFDLHRGYEVTWSRSIPGLTVEGDVEYKSLPSGLHAVERDVVYFTHGVHAGVSCFVRRTLEGREGEGLRGARMISVGALVPLSYGRLGRGWLRVEGLGELAEKLCVENPDMKLLDDYWITNSLQDGNDERQFADEAQSPAEIGYKPFRSKTGLESHKNNGHSHRLQHCHRSISDGSLLSAPGHKLSPYHPAYSLNSLLDTFEPLIFPLYRAALLRKRILIVGHAPVRQMCEFVYDISVLSNIPTAATRVVDTSAVPARLRPLFNIGVHDISMLEEDAKAMSDPNYTPVLGEVEEEPLGRGWVACTTDGILATKEKLWDVLVTLPPAHATDAKEKVWPQVKERGYGDVKATQRDARRYRNLMWHLNRSQLAIPMANAAEDADEQSQFTGLRRRSTERSIQDVLAPEAKSEDKYPDMDTIIEPYSWSHLAYDGFLWWASAGSSITLDSDDDEHDRALLDGLGLEPISPAPKLADGAAKKETTIIAYFHRLSTLILETLNDLIDSTESEGDDEDSDDSLSSPLQPERGLSAVFVGKRDMGRLGLDWWSGRDRLWVEECLGLYFGREGRVEGEGLEVCGMRVC